MRRMPKRELVPTVMVVVLAAAGFGYAWAVGATVAAAAQGFLALAFVGRLIVSAR